MADTNKIAYSDLIQNDGAFEELKRNIEEANRQYKQFVDNSKKEAKELENTMRSTSAATKEGRTQIQQSAKAVDALAKARQKLDEAYASEAVELAEINRLTKEQNQINNLVAKQISTVEGSVENLAAKYALLRIETNSLENAEERSISTQQELTSELEKTAISMYQLQIEEKRRQSDLKLTAKLLASEEGSYNQLAAKYDLIKNELNALSSAERNTTERGKELEATALSIRNEMKRLQEQTGNTTLSVGDYEKGSVQLTTEIRKQTYELAKLRLAGKENTQEYINQAKELATLKNALTNATTEVARMASNTTTLDGVLSGLSGASGALSAATGLFALLGTNADDYSRITKNLAATIAVANGIQQAANAIQSNSAFITLLTTTRLKALQKAKALDRLITIQGAAATTKATNAQWLFNIAANANPYWALVGAITGLIAVYAIFYQWTYDVVKVQTQLNEVTSIYIDLIEQESKIMTQESDKNIKRLENELKIAQARNASASEINKIEEELASARKRRYNLLLGYYSQEYNDLDDNIEKLNEFRRELNRLQQAKALGQTKVEIEIDGYIERVKIDKAIDIVQSRVDNTGRLVEIGVQLRNEGLDLDTDYKVQQAKRVEQLKQFANQERNLIRVANQERLKLITDNAERERMTLVNSYDERIADLQQQLKTEKDLTEKGRQAINDTIQSIEEQKRIALIDNENKLQNSLREIRRNSEDLSFATMRDSLAKERSLLTIEYTRRIEDLQTYLDQERGISQIEREAINEDIINIEKALNLELSILDNNQKIQRLESLQTYYDNRLNTVESGTQEEINLIAERYQVLRQIELLQNRNLAEELRQDESEINRKYDAIILQEVRQLQHDRETLTLSMQQDLQSAEFDLLRTSEGQKTRFLLQQDKERLKLLLNQYKQINSEIAREQVKIVEAQINAIDKKIKKSQRDERYTNVLSIFGLYLDDSQKQAISTSVDYTLQYLTQYYNAATQLTQKLVNNAQSEVDSIKSRLETEIDARNQGYANQVDTVKAELALAEEKHQQALEENAKAQKKQEQIEALQQASSLITASAMIWAQLGFPAAIAGIAAMWGSFAAAKIKARQLTNSDSDSTYGDGGLEFLQGGSHRSGNDIYIGKKSDGSNMRAEGGEALAVFNKPMTRKYRSILPDIVNSLNKGTFEDVFTRSFNTSKWIGYNVNADVDMSETNNHLSAIRKNSDRNISYSGNTRIERYKNRTTIIKS